jgi:hypothetical protein
MRLAMTGFAILLTSAIYLAIVHASVHVSAERLDANGNAAIERHV